MSREKFSKIFYIASDVINTVVMVLGIITFVAITNSFTDADLGYIIVDNPVRNIIINEYVLFPAMVVLYAGATLFGFICRAYVSGNDNVPWPHVTYIILAYVYLSFSANFMFFTNLIFFHIFVFLNFVVALVAGISGLGE